MSQPPQRRGRTRPAGKVVDVRPVKLLGERGPKVVAVDLAMATPAMIAELAR